MATKGFVETKDDSLTLLALGRKMVVLPSLDGVEDDVSRSLELERVRNRHGTGDTSTRQATDVLRLIEQPSSDGHVALGEGTAVR